MKIFLLANNWVGLEITKFLKATEEIVGLSIHDPEMQRYTEEIIENSGIPEDRIFLASKLHDLEVMGKIKTLDAEMGITSFWGTLLKPEFFNMFPKGCINFHPSYLPFNRGSNPNVWPIIEKTPAGVTLHHIDDGIDTGDIIARREVEVEITDTGGTLYEKTLTEIVDLFKETWPSIKKGTAPRNPQKKGSGNFHRKKHIDELDLINLDRQYSGRELINRIRSRSYGDYTFAYFEENGKKVYIKLDLSYDRNFLND